ncbi:hypothetical protein V5N11_002940 [Cardamine amara subsp. amara]|uniref:Uncharacterized protein n=1 Tax=Cardamine amara subsp. amara TaxID=228776 RepID=A0ABD1A4F4_CARAN
MSERNKAAIDNKVMVISKEMRVRLPFRETKSMIPLLKEHVEKVIAGMPTLHEASDILQQACNMKTYKKFPTKLTDPGRFALSCTIGDYLFKQSLVDTGDSVNMMPLSESQRLGLIFMQPTAISLTMAHGSTQRPLERLVNIPILVGGSYAFVDFLVLNLDDEGTYLILGHPYLATTKASINMPNGKIKLRFEKAVMSFYVETVDKLPTMDGKTFMVADSEAIDVV